VPRSGFPYFIWLTAAGLAGFASGKIMGGQGLRRVADILLGVAAACLSLLYHGGGGRSVGICLPASILNLGAGRAASTGLDYC